MPSTSNTQLLTKLKSLAKEWEKEHNELTKEVELISQFLEAETIDAIYWQALPMKLFLTTAAECLHPFTPILVRLPHSISFPDYPALHLRARNNYQRAFLLYCQNEIGFYHTFWKQSCIIIVTLFASAASLLCYENYCNKPSEPCNLPAFTNLAEEITKYFGSLPVLVAGLGVSWLLWTTLSFMHYRYAIYPTLTSPSKVLPVLDILVNSNNVLADIMALPHTTLATSIPPLGTAIVISSELQATRVEVAASQTARAQP